MNDTQKSVTLCRAIASKLLTGKEARIAPDNGQRIEGVSNETLCPIKEHKALFSDHNISCQQARARAFSGCRSSSTCPASSISIQFCGRLIANTRGTEAGQNCESACVRAGSCGKAGSQHFRYNSPRLV